MQSTEPTWKEIESKLKLTLPQAHILSIQVIQNINLWRKFQVELEQLKQKLKKDLKPELLWHGTSETNPQFIISGQEGFDMRYGRENGMWGRAVYFAQNAKYSYSYAFQANGSRQMFLAEVILGDSVLLAQQSLIKPPNNPNNGMEYDSVQGFTGDSNVFMVYANQKCYPRYLVTFQ